MIGSNSVVSSFLMVIVESLLEMVLKPTLWFCFATPPDELSFLRMPYLLYELFLRQEN